MSNRKSPEARQLMRERRTAERIRMGERNRARMGKRAERRAFGGAW